MPAPQTVGERTRELVKAGVPVAKIEQLFLDMTGRPLREIPEDWPLARARAKDLPALSVDLADAPGAPVAPAGDAVLQPYKNVFAPTAKLGGMFKGFSEAVGDIASEGMAVTGDILTEAMANLSPFYSGPVTRTTGGPLAKAAKEREEELQRKAKRPFAKALAMDVGETLSALPAFAAGLGEGVVYPASVPADVDEQKYLERQGHEIGKAVTTGAVLSPLMLAAHPGLSARAEPFQTALVVAPEARAVGGLLKSTKVGERLAQAAKVAKGKVGAALERGGLEPLRYDPDVAVREARKKAAEAAGAATRTALSAVEEGAEQEAGAVRAAGVRAEEAAKSVARTARVADVVKGLRELPESARRMFLDATASADPELRALLVGAVLEPEHVSTGLKKVWARAAALDEPGDVAPVVSKRTIDDSRARAAREEAAREFAARDPVSLEAQQARGDAEELARQAESAERAKKERIAAFREAVKAGATDEELARLDDDMVRAAADAKVARGLAAAVDKGRGQLEQQALAGVNERRAVLGAKDPEFKKLLDKEAREAGLVAADARGRQLHPVRLTGGEGAAMDVPRERALPFDETAYNEAVAKRKAAVPGTPPGKLKELDDAVAAEEAKVRAQAAARAAGADIDLASHPYFEFANAVVGRGNQHALEATLAELQHVIHGEHGAPEILRVPEIRKAVVRNMRKRVSTETDELDMRWGGAARGVSGLNLVDDFEKYLGKLVEFDPEYKVNVPQHPLLQKALADVINEMPDLREHVIRATTDQMAERAGRQQMAGALKMEGDKLDALVRQTRQAEAEQRQRGTVLEEDPRPDLVQAWRDINVYAVNGDLNALLQTLKDERQGLKENAYAVRANERGEAIKRVISKLERFKQLDPELTGSSAWVDPIVHDAITTSARAKEALRDLSFWGVLTNQMKRNLTSRNIKSAFNNLGSNMLMQAIRTGDPLGGISEALRAWQAYKELGRWERGDIKPVHFKGGMGKPVEPPWTPEQKQGVKWTALVKTGVFDSTALDKDMRVFSTGVQKASLNPVAAMETFYKAGDNFFKAGEASTEYDRILGKVERLKVNEYIDLPDQSGRDRRLLVVGQKPDGPVFLLLDPAGGGHNKLIARYELPDIIAQAAANSANNLFFDYSQVPRLAEILRYQPALGLLSPFYAWAVKALDLPGKKGLGYQVIAGRPTYSTNSKAVLRNQAREQMLLGARRAVILGGLKADLQGKRSQELLEGAQYLPNEVKLGLARVASDPNYVEIARMGNWNFLTADLDLFKVLAEGIAGEDDPTEGGALRLPSPALEQQLAKDRQALSDPAVQKDPEVRAALERRVKEIEGKLAVPVVEEGARAAARFHGTGQSGGLQEVFSLFGMAGSPLAELVALGRRDQVYGEDLGVDDVLKQFGKAVLGGTAADVVDTAILGALGPGTRWSSYRYSATPETREDVARFIIRKLTGMGWMRVAPEDTDKFFTRARDEWKAALGVKKLKKEMESYEEQKLFDKAKAVEGELDRLEDIVDDEVDAMQDDYDATKALLGIKQDAARGAKSY